MADNTWQKELKRATDNIGAVRTDVYLVKKWQAAWILGFACIMLIGLIMQLVTANLNVRALGLILVLVGAVAIVAVYLIMRYRGPLNYTTYYYRSKEGAEFVLQVISRKWIILSSGGTTLEYDRRDVKRRDGLYGTAHPWDWFRSASFLSAEDKGKDRRFIGVYNTNGVDAKAMLSVRNSVIDYAEAGGVRMRYFDVNALHGKVAVPPELYRAALKAGIKVGNAEFIQPASEVK